MAISEELGERRTVGLPAGRLEYRERGSGPPLIFVHGAAVNGDLWRKVVPELAADRRCIAPDLPLGGHTLPLDGEPDLSKGLPGRLVPTSRVLSPDPTIPGDLLGAGETRALAAAGGETGGYDANRR